ncbi:uncharacterized protein RCO7_02532 [Rhynchosporium graminicola]|uniref:FAD-binding PCMH-type domain-containing protein n=1 Tax=Rhynchosporium graminicola TaxID=2792576 RepID=A0A1E1JV45_9HELO|nr:uncharacterized protein RCO7_02532 [Rhynchosporium commune]
MKRLILLIALKPLKSLAFGSQVPKDEILHCCSILAPLQTHVSFPHSPVYVDETTGDLTYWSSFESDLSPACRFSPTNTADLALGVGLLASNKCEFAIRSGGHMSFAGASNYDGKGKDGVTIDLSSMNEVQVLDSWAQNVVFRAEKVVKLGPGARWGDVYAKLDPLNVTVPGARVDSVGVGGYLLGGGLSYFAHTVGFACNSVLQYEVVLGNGSVVLADSLHNPDLWLALRGGHNNLGVVSSFTMKPLAIPDGIWAGNAISEPRYADQTFDALYHFGEVAGRDGLTTDISGSTSIFYFKSTRSSFISNFLVSSTGTAFPAILANFTSIPQTSNTFRKASLRDLAVELGGSESGAYVRGHRQILGEVTFKNNIEMMKEGRQLFEAAFAPFAEVEGYTQAFILQPLHRAILAASEKMGGNIMGLGAKDGNTVWFAIILTWDDTSFDDAINTATEKFFADFNVAAKRLGVYHPFVYLNYATKDQDPISSYGRVNVQRLKAASRKYDPDQVFQRLVPGGFKLPDGEGNDDDGH